MSLYKKVIKKLLDKNISISVAESCTGGMVSGKITEFSGVSKIFNMGLVVYSNKSKKLLLKINKEKLDKYGAVSNEIAEEMILNLYKISKSNLCISTTGIAGPSGSTKEKPVGLVYIGIKFLKNVKVIKKKFNGTRVEIQNKTLNTVFKEINKLI
tara:strand:- start:1333 stop:1797 length:465 start_codon:yes stop_codon:yes gene_type:complete